MISRKDSTAENATSDRKNQAAAKTVNEAHAALPSGKTLTAVEANIVETDSEQRRETTEKAVSKAANAVEAAATLANVMNKKTE